jgi:hypothetical protein
LRPLSLARTPDEPQFGVALLKLVIELRHRPRGGLEEAILKALKGMRVDRDAFRRFVQANRERYEVAAGPPARALVRAR